MPVTDPSLIVFSRDNQSPARYAGSERLVSRSVSGTESPAERSN